MHVERWLSSQDNLVARGGPVELPSSLLVSPEFSCHFHQTSPGFSSLSAQGFFQMLSV